MYLYAFLAAPRDPERSERPERRFVQLPRRPWVLAQAAGLGVIVAALWHDLLAALQQTVTWPADFASYYVPARAVLTAPRTNIYDYALLLRLNDLHHWVSAPASYTGSAFYPYIYPPFALIILRPLAGLDFGPANSIWVALMHAFALGAALLLADAFVRAVRQRAMSKAPSSLAQRADLLLAATALPIGRWRFPVLPFAATSVVLLFAWPAADTYYFGQINFAVVFFVALALDAHLARRPVLAGFAIAIAGALKLTPLFLLAYFAVRRSWRALIAGAAFTALLAALPLLFFPSHDYRMFFTELQTLDPSLTGAAHNESLVGVFIHVAALFGGGVATSVPTITSSTTTAGGVVPGEDLGEVVAVLLALVTLAGVFLAGLPRPLNVMSVVGRLRRTAGKKDNGVSAGSRRKSGERPSDAAHDTDTSPDPLELDWLGFALVLVIYMLATPLVWSHYYVVALPAALLLAGFPFVRRGGAEAGTTARDGWNRGDALAVYFALAALALLMEQLPYAVDRGDPGVTGLLRLLLVSSRAAGMLLIWGALGALLLRRLRPPTGSMRNASATGAEGCGEAADKPADKPASAAIGETAD
jgi:Glycosyltransferase family 87